jgi:hypothetical protein
MVKTLGSQKLRMLLTHRQLLQSKAIAVENDLRGTLRNFGLPDALARLLVRGLAAEVVGPAGVEPLYGTRERQPTQPEADRTQFSRIQR